MTSLSFLADEHVKRVYVTELRSNGYDVAVVDGDYAAGTPDADLLAESHSTNRILLSNDSDFAVLDAEYDHAGIILYDDQTMSVTDFIQGINTIERHVPTDEIQNEIFWLDEWM